MAQRNVVFLLNSLAVGGSEKKAVGLARRLADKGIVVSCAYMQRPDALAAEIPASIPLWFLDRKGRLSLRVIRRLFKRLRESGPAVVVAVNLYPSLYAAALARIAPRLAPRTVCLMNTATFERSRDHWYRPLYMWGLRCMDVVVYGSENQRALWVARGSTSWSRSRVIYNGVELDRFDGSATSGLGSALRVTLGIPESRFVFGSVGRIASEKNYGVLVEVLAALRRTGVDAQLLLAGDGPMRAQVEGRADELGVRDRLSLLGQVHDVRPALAAMDVFVLPSTNETFSNAALEAMAMARPVILSDVGGAAEMVNQGVSGYLVPLRPMESEIVTCLTKLAGDVVHRRAMGAAARKCVAARFSLEAMFEQYLQTLAGR